jgi:hypothetical protein
MNKKLDYFDIQTPPEVWSEILKLNPIDTDAIFFEPFAGECSLYNQIGNEKYWCEIELQKDVFDFEDVEKITCIYTNPPYKADIPQKSGIKKYKNASFFFLSYFCGLYPNLDTIGFLMSANLFNALTPFRLNALKEKGFTISAITILNTNFWRSTHYFVVFKKDNTDNAKIHIIPKTFQKKMN